MTRTGFHLTSVCQEMNDNLKLFCNKKGSESPVHHETSMIIMESIERSRSDSSDVQILGNELQSDARYAANLLANDSEQFL